jgi:hypothetical protein
MMKNRALTPLCALFLARAVSGCGDGGETREPPPPPEVAPSIAFVAADPCAATVPQPTDLFNDENGVDVSAACASPSDPVDAAIKLALADDGVAIDAPISIPMAGEIQAESVVGSTTAIHLIQWTGTSTEVEEFEARTFSASVDGNTIRVTPGAPLLPSHYYVVIATDSITAKDKAITQHPAIKALVGTAPIAANAFEGLDEATAARLERQRLRLIPVLEHLENNAPFLVREKVRSISGFSTSLGFARLQNVIAQYRAAFMAEKFPFQIETTGGEIPPADVYPPGTPAQFYANVRAFLRGFIHVPKMLDAEGHMRPDWATAGETLKVPFLVSLPPGTAYPVALYLPGLKGSKQDVREIASAMAGPARAATFGFDLRCHGDRAPDAEGKCKDERTAAEIDALIDTGSNGNPERTGADGVPDNSGVGFFPGDPRALRDTQIAAVIETLHIAETFQRGGAVVSAAGLSVNNLETHIIGHGHSANVALLAASFTRSNIRTITLPSGGANIRQIVQAGSNEVKAAFDASVPAGVTAANREMYLMRLEASVLQAVSPQETTELARERYVRPFRNSERILLPHSTNPDVIPVAARMVLIEGLGLTAINRVSRHNGDCDRFYLHTCRLGDDVGWGDAARNQLTQFVGSGGVTVAPPAQ